MPSQMGNQLTRTIHDDFPSGVRHRGRDYLAHGAVRVQHIGPTSIRAQVSGTQMYTTSLDWSGRESTASCDCPYFHQYGPCKHLWAVAEAYEASGRIPAGLRGKALVMAGDDGDDDYLDDDDGEDYVEDDNNSLGDADGERDENGFVISRLEDARRRMRQPYPSPPKAPSWRESLTGLFNLTDRAANRSRDALPADGQLHYVIEVPTTLNGAGLAVNVLLSKRKKNGDWGVAKPRAISRAQINGLTDPADRQIVAMLLGANTQTYNYYGYQDWRASTFLLPEELTEAVLPLLCASGRCRLKAASGEESGPVQLDGGGPGNSR